MARWASISQKPTLAPLSAGAFFILSLQQALAAYQGVKFNHEVIIIPTPIISWFPFLVFGETHIPRCEFINVMSLGKILGQEIIGFPTFLNDFCIALADKKNVGNFVMAYRLLAQIRLFIEKIGRDLGSMAVS